MQLSNLHLSRSQVPHHSQGHGLSPDQWKAIKKPMTIVRNSLRMRMDLSLQSSEVETQIDVNKN